MTQREGFFEFLPMHMGQNIAAQDKKDIYGIRSLNDDISQYSPVNFFAEPRKIAIRCAITRVEEQDPQGRKPAKTR